MLNLTLIADAEAMSGTWTAAIAAVIGAGTAGILTHFITRRNQSLDLVDALYREFHSREFYETITAAHEYLRELDARGGPKDLNQAYTEHTDLMMAANSVWAVMAFYRKLWVLISHRRVQTSLVPDLFGRDFIWWWNNCFRDRISQGCEEYADLLKLDHWIGGNTTEPKRTSWQKHAEDTALA